MPYEAQIATFLGQIARALARIAACMEAAEQRARDNEGFYRPQSPHPIEDEINRRLNVPTWYAVASAEAERAGTTVEEVLNGYARAAQAAQKALTDLEKQVQDE